MKKNWYHSLSYILEFLIIFGGFFMLLTIPFTFLQQLLFLGLILIFYIVIGLFHHRMHHTLKGKVVLEYILISVFIFTLFVFLNSTHI